MEILVNADILLTRANRAVLTLEGVSKRSTEISNLVALAPFPVTVEFRDAMVALFYALEQHAEASEEFFNFIRDEAKGRKDDLEKRKDDLESKE